MIVIQEALYRIYLHFLENASQSNLKFLEI